MSDNQRLERIEDKVDKLVDAMLNLVRLEERIQSQGGGMERLGARLDVLETEIKLVNDKMPILNLIVTGFGKIGLAVITLAVIGVAGSYLVGK